MAFDTLDSPMIVAGNSCIYANGSNQMKITVSFTAQDKNSNTIPLTSSEMQRCVHLINYDASSTDQHLSDSGSNWSVAYSAGTYYNYPPGGASREEITHGGERDSVSSIDFYIATALYVSDVQIGYVIKTETGKIYTCWAGTDDTNNIASPAKFALLYPVVYSMDNCTDTLDAVSNDYLKVHYLHINDQVVSGAYIAHVNFDGYPILAYAGFSGQSHLDTWWSFTIDEWGYGFFYLTFAFTTSGDTYDLWNWNTHLCYIPYNTDGKCVTSALYWAENDYGPDYGAQSGSPPGFTIFDQWGNSGRFTLELVGKEQGFIKYIAMS